jgi:hypothetical protein
VSRGRAAELPPPGRTVLRPVPAGPPEDLLAVGFAGFGGFALRVDILERVAARVRAEARRGPTFTVPPALAAEAGLSRDELAALVAALGFAPVPDGAEGGTAEYTRPARAQRRRQGDRTPRPATPPSAGSPFAVLARLKVAP